MQPNAKQAIKKMIWHYEYELLCATNSSDKEKFAEKQQLLIKQFKENFARFDVAESILAAGPN